MGDLAGGEVHRDARRAVAALGLPGGELLAGLAQHGVADGHDEAGLLGQADEVAGAHQAPLRVLPAHEGLGPDLLGLAVLGGLQRQGRLPDHDELVVVDRPAQRGGLVDALAGLAAQVVVVELGAVGPGAGGPVDGGVGLAEHALGVGVGGGVHRHADAGGGAEGHVAGDEGPGDGDAHPVGEVGDVVDGAVGDVEHGELVGPHAGDHVVVAHGLAQTTGDRDDEGVGDTAAVAVDQLLEAVEVDDQHGDQRVGVGDAVEGLLEPVAQQRPVGEPGERVLEAEVVGLEVGPGPLERRRHDVGEALDEGDLVGVEGAQGGRQHRQRAVEARAPRRPRPPAHWPAGCPRGRCRRGGGRCGGRRPRGASPG